VVVVVVVVVVVLFRLGTVDRWLLPTRPPPPRCRCCWFCWSSSLLLIQPITVACNHN
jgi:hypothetical protein